MAFMRYDSPWVQLLNRVTDMILLNVLYLFSCIPLFTIGAAQAGLYTAVKVMLDKEDDSSVFAAYWRGFRSGFGTITAAWGLVTLLLLFVIWIDVSAYMLGAPLVVLIIGAAIVVLFQTILPAFHSRFASDFKMLLRNTFFFIIAYPLHCLAVTVITILPVILTAFIDLYTLLGGTPILIMFYYSAAIMTSFMLLRKPFNTLISMNQHATEDADAAENAEITEE